jgi:hypothetical protein
MRRWDVVVLLITAMVICPIDCWTLATACRQSQVSVEAQPPTSLLAFESCCCGCQRESTPSIPLGEGPCDEGSNDCICKAGPVAVKWDKIQPFAVSLFRRHTGAAIRGGETSVVSDRPLWSFHGTWGANAGGRAVRILLSSFLA